MLITLTLLGISFIALILMFVNRNQEKSRGTVVLSWVIVILLFFIVANLFLSEFAHNAARVRFAACPPELIIHDSTFGNRCGDQITNPIERVIDENFGGPFDGLLVIVFGIPAVLVLSIVGFIIEVMSAKKRNQRITKTFWSPSFFTLISIGTLLVGHLLFFLLFVE